MLCAFWFLVFFAESLSTTYSAFSDSTSTSSSFVDPTPTTYLTPTAERTTDLHCLLSASTPNVNTTASSMATASTPASNPSPQQPIPPPVTQDKNDFLTPQAPRGWNKSGGEAPDVGLYFPSAGGPGNVKPTPPSFTPKSSVSSTGGFRPVKFNASDKAGVFDASGPTWRGGGAKAGVSEELGYCDLWTWFVYIVLVLYVFTFHQQFSCVMCFFFFFFKLLSKK